MCMYNVMYRYYHNGVSIPELYKEVCASKFGYDVIIIVGLFVTVTKA